MYTLKPTVDADDILKERFSFSNRLLIVTGANGSGKTRLLKALEKREIKFICSDSRVYTPNSLPLEALVAGSQGGARNCSYDDQIKFTLDLFERRREAFNLPYDAGIDQAESEAVYTRLGLTYRQLLNLCHQIASRSGKSLQEITGEDIRMNYADVETGWGGLGDFSLVCDHYIRREEQNKYNEFLSRECGEQVTYLSKEERRVMFGSAPWDLMNQVLKNVFDGKFQLIPPEVPVKAGGYEPIFFDGPSQRPIHVSRFSSGEQVLMWMAVNIFRKLYLQDVGPAQLLLMDEPDAYLHPGMVEKLYKLFEVITSSNNVVIVFVTHSPTTVALAPAGASIALKGDGILIEEGKDEAIAKLLIGINYLSVLPENRRQVYVESTYDVEWYSNIYYWLRRHSHIDPKISLSFVGSGPTFPKEMLENKVRQFFKNDTENTIQGFLTAMGGDGDCSKVKAAVEKLVDDGNKFIRGIVDWDLKNVESDFVKVLGSGFCYAADNALLEPLAVIFALQEECPKHFPVSKFCKEDVHYTEWLSRPDLLQASVDNFTFDCLGVSNDRSIELQYVGNQVKIFAHKSYFQGQGHGLSQHLLRRYPVLKGMCKNNEKILPREISDLFLRHTNGGFVLDCFRSLFLSLQV